MGLLSVDNAIPLAEATMHPLSLEPNANNVSGMSFTAAIDMGFNPRDYAYGVIPEGIMLARLDFKVWNKAPSLGLYFTNLADLNQYKLTAFKNIETGSYCDRSGEVCFEKPMINGKVYELTIKKQGRGYHITHARQLN